MTREEAIEQLKEIPIGYEVSDDYMKTIYEAIDMAIKALDQEPKMGHWILTDDDFVYCSECEDSYYARPIDASWYYCPHCGAKMESEE